jgi:hypothetical protein
VGFAQVTNAPIQSGLPMKLQKGGMGGGNRLLEKWF